MQVLSEEKSRLLAEKNGWSHKYAEGLVEGETFRRVGKTLTTYTLVGIDEYALGFRAGYFERQMPVFGRIASVGAAARGPRNVRQGHVAGSTEMTEYLPKMAQQ